VVMSYWSFSQRPRARAPSTAPQPHEQSVGLGFEVPHGLLPSVLAPATPFSHDGSLVATARSCKPDGLRGRPCMVDVALAARRESDGEGGAERSYVGWCSAR